MLTAFLTLATSAVALAASDYKTISSVSIRVSSKLEPGYVLPDIDFGSESASASDGQIVVSVSSDKYYIYDAKWTSSTTRVMTAGYSPEMRVYLAPYDIDEYRFKGTYNANNVTVRGATYSSASKSGNNLTVRIKVNPIKGDFDSPDNVGWRSSSKGTAKWTAPDDNDSGRYEVELRRGSTKVTTIETNSTSYNFYPYMTQEGYYTFRVRTIPRTSNQEQYGDNSEWVESDELYIAEDEVSDGEGISSIASEIADIEGLAGWINDGRHWFYRYPDGRYLSNGWLQLGDKWYLFDSEGQMLTGWQYHNDHYFFFDTDGSMHTGWLSLGDGTYYLNPTKDQFEGCMLSGGAFNIDGETYCFNSSGRLATGWQQVGDEWCYFDPSTGIMARNTVVDTFPVGDNGAWIH